LVNLFSNFASFPEIRLCGKWLQEMGFQHGQTIKVKQEMNRITITVEEGGVANDA